MMHSQENITKLAELIKDIKMTMLTTLDNEGHLRSRPMATQEVEFDGELWFFTGNHSGKVEELDRNAKVNLAYAEPSHNRYVSVSGFGEIVYDKMKAKELWSPAMKAWFPKGLEDPDLALLKVTVEKAEYWDAPSSKLVTLVGFAKAIVTGHRIEKIGEHGEIH